MISGVNSFYMNDSEFISVMDGNCIQEESGTENILIVSDPQLYLTDGPPQYVQMFDSCIGERMTYTELKSPEAYSDSNSNPVVFKVPAVPKRIRLPNSPRRTRGRGFLSSFSGFKSKDRRRSGGGMTHAERKRSACERERNRMEEMNAGFDRLRNVLPATKPPGKKLSKIECLKLAIRYIAQLTHEVNSPTCSTSGIEYDTHSSHMWATAPNYYSWIKQEMDHVSSSHTVDQVFTRGSYFWQAEDRQRQPYIYPDT